MSDFEENSQAPSEGTKKLDPKAKRGKLIRAWIVRNKAGIKPQTTQDTNLRAQFAQKSRIRDKDFWRTMTMYGMLSKGEQPDLKQIIDHIKRSDHKPVAALQLGKTEYWWEYVQDGKEWFYTPIFDNANRATLASGLFHHFVFETYDNPDERKKFLEESWALPAKEPRVIKDHEIEAFFEKETPFRKKADPRAFLVIPKLNSPHTDNTSCLDQLKASGASHLSAAGTYRLLQTVNKHDIFLRPAREPVNEDGLVKLQLEAEHGSISLTILNDVHVYASSQNVMSLNRPHDTKDPERLARYQQVGLRIKNPGSGIAGSPGHHVPSLITDTIKSLDDDMYETQHMRIYPIRSLLPPFALATAIDYGALWSGCLAPKAGSSIPLYELAAHFKEAGVSPNVTEYFFQTRNGLRTPDSPVTVDEYIRFMNWFAAFPQGFGPDHCWLLALYDSLHGQPFSVKLRELAKDASRGTYSVRLGTSKAFYLVVDVLCGDLSVISHRVHVLFTRVGAPAYPCGVTFTLEYEDGTPVTVQRNGIDTIVRQEGTLQGLLLEEIQRLSGVSVLTPFTLVERKPTYLKINTGSASVTQNADVDPCLDASDFLSDLDIMPESEDVGGSFGGGGGYNSFGSDLDLSAILLGQDAAEDVHSGSKGHPLSPDDQDQARRVRQRT